MRATSFQSVTVWPGDEGSIDENSVRANYRLIKHVPPAYKLWNDVLRIDNLTWVMDAVAECWEAMISHNKKHIQMAFHKIPGPAKT